jgi:hypothetical protein
LLIEGLGNHEIRIEYAGGGYRLFGSGLISVLLFAVELVNAQTVRRIFPSGHSASANLPYAAAVSDSSADNVWNAGNVGPQWIELDLGGPKSISKIRLQVCQYPPSVTNHILKSSSSDAPPFETFGAFNGYTSDSQWLEIVPATSPTTARKIRITTTSVASWICWREIEVYEAVGTQDPCANPTPLAFGQTIRSTFSPNSPPRCYAINAASGDRIQLTTQGFADNSNLLFPNYPGTQTILYAPDGAPINSSVTYGGSDSGTPPPFWSIATQVLTASSSGAYKVRLTAYPFAVADVALKLSSIDGYITPSGFTQPSSTNVALATAGSAATASSTYPYGNYSPGGVIDGNRKGNPWGGNAGWNDFTINQLPDWLQVNFAGEKIIDTINVFSVQDAWLAPSEPTGAMTFSNFGLIDFDVQYWLVSAGGWVTVPGGAIRNNNRVWKSVWFPPAATSSIRIVVYRAGDGFTRITEVEAWTPGARDPSNTRWGPPPGPKPPEPPLPSFPSTIF